MGPGFRVRLSGGRERAAGACPAGGAGPTGGGAARGLTAAVVTAAAAAALGSASLAATGSRGGAREGPGPRVEEEVRDGGAWRWWASPERPPSSVSGAGRRAAEGGV